MKNPVSVSDKRSSSEVLMYKTKKIFSSLGLSKNILTFRPWEPRDSYLRDPHWVLEVEYDRKIVLLTPHEVNELYDDLKRMKHAVLFQFEAYLQNPCNNATGVLHEKRGFSIPSGSVLNIRFPHVFGELSLFSASLYFKTFEQEFWLARYLGQFFANYLQSLC